MTDEITNQQRHESFTAACYYKNTTRDINSIRAGHSDASHMCDAIADDIRREHTVGGRVTKRGLELAAAVKRAGDAIWAMREKVS